MKQHNKLLIALLLGITLGGIAHPFVDQVWIAWVNTNILGVVGQIFLRMIFMVVVPMIFSALVLGVLELSQGHGLGKVASKTLLYTIILSSASVLIGIGLVNTLKPGAGFSLDPSIISAQSSQVATIEKNAQSAKPFAQAFVELIPKNPLDSAVRAFDGEIIALMVFALIFGIALAHVLKKSETKQSPLVSILNTVFQTCMMIVDYAMKIAPIAVFGIVFNTVFKFGFGVLHSLLFYVITVVAGLLIQQVFVYSFMLKTIAKHSPWEFFKSTREVLLYAFSTASSNATLPRTLEVAEDQLKLPPQVSRFVLTIGATANQNGTALFEGVTVLFLAQVYGIELSFLQQGQVVLMSILAGIGTAGIPGGSLPLIALLLQSVGIPPEGLGLILGVDRFLDMCRTTLNVSGDLVIATLVSKNSATA